MRSGGARQSELRFPALKLLLGRETAQLAMWEKRRQNNLLFGAKSGGFMAGHHGDSGFPSAGWPCCPARE
jgi:hypothetical protein